MFNPNDKRSVDQRARRERLEQARTADDVRVVMRTPEGRRFVHGLLGLCGMRESAYCPGDLGAQRHQDYMLGRQSVGFDLLREVETHAAPEAEQMMAEARAAAAERRQILEAEAVEGEQEQTDG